MGESCDSWFDGCNSCRVMGYSLACTRKYCANPGKAYCKDSADCPLKDTYGNCVEESCDSWFDGCNSCRITDKGLACTKMSCASPVKAYCKDSADCPLKDTYGNCVEESCDSWFDGCNSCRVMGDSLACTMMYCGSPGKAYCNHAADCPMKDTYGNCIEKGCSTWYDGCNNCVIDSTTSKLQCTKKFCLRPKKPKCGDVRIGTSDFETARQDVEGVQKSKRKRKGKRGKKNVGNSRRRTKKTKMTKSKKSKKSKKIKKSRGRTSRNAK